VTSSRYIAASVEKDGRQAFAVIDRSLGTLLPERFAERADAEKLAQRLNPDLPSKPITCRDPDTGAGRELVETPALPWWLIADMPLRKAYDEKRVEPCIFDANGRFVADFGYHEGSTANAQLVMRALDAESRLSALVEACGPFVGIAAGLKGEDHFKFVTFPDPGGLDIGDFRALSAAVAKARGEG
jgi:hypothetical protein